MNLIASVVVNMRETPAQEMQRLGREHIELMSRRYTAYKGGLNAIHTALIALTNKNEARQTELLNEHPELALTLTQEAK